MKFLVDTSPKSMQQKLESDLVAGQLLTPLTRYSNAGGTFAIDNGAFSGFRARDFATLLEREHANRGRCLFVVCPDVVGNGRRTLEIWRHRYRFAKGWPMAFVAQNGVEDLDIPWDGMAALFLGGTDPWKDSNAAQDLVRTARTLGIHTHIGRVNEIRRYRRFAELGADTCDGSGIAMYDHMLQKIESELAKTDEPNLFAESDEWLSTKQQSTEDVQSTDNGITTPSKSAQMAS